VQRLRGKLGRDRIERSAASATAQALSPVRALHRMLRLRPARPSLRWKIAGLPRPPPAWSRRRWVCSYHLWTAHDIRDRAEMRAFNDAYSAMETYRRTGLWRTAPELDPAGLPAALRHPADEQAAHGPYDGHVDGNLGPSVWGAQRTGGPDSAVLAVRINMNSELHELRRLDMVMAVAR